MLKLAVVTTYYNEVETIDDVVHAIATYASPCEYYLVDDCSTLLPEKVLEKYGSEPWFHYIRNDKNLGAGGALNRGIQAALDDGADLIAINDADDISYEARFRDQMNAFKNDKDLMLIGGAADMTNSETGTVMWRCYHPETNSGIRRALKVNAPFVHSTVMYRAEVFKRVGLYNEVSYALDYEMISRVIHAGCKAANLGKLVLKYNIRPNSMSVTKRRTQIASRLSTQLRFFDAANFYSYWGVARSCFAYILPRDTATFFKSVIHKMQVANPGEKTCEKPL